MATDTPGLTGRRDAPEVHGLVDWRERALFAQSPIPIFVLDGDGLCIQANAACARMLRMRRNILLGARFLNHVTADHVQLERIRQFLDSEQESELNAESIVLVSEHARVMVRCHMRRVADGANPPVVIVHVSEAAEVTAAMRDLERRAANEEMFRNSVHGSAIPTALLDLRGTVIEVNPAMEAHLAAPRDMLIGMSLDPFMSLPLAHGFRNQFRSLADGVTPTLRLRGQWITQAGKSVWSEMTASGIHLGGRLNHVVLHVVDVSSEQDALSQLEHRSGHDDLTGLANRNEILTYITRAAAHAASTGTHMAVFYIDVDNFKQINDGLGHEIGDQVLIAVAQRLRAGVRSRDAVGRLSGDEFVVVIEGLRDGSETIRIAENLRHNVAQTLPDHESRILPTVSMGATTSRGGREAGDLLREADDALRHAKRNGRNRVEHFDAAMSSSARERIDLESRIRDAVQHKRIETHYQPVVDLTTGRLVGYEALARMREASGSIPDSAAFVSVAERSGLIVGVGDQVIRQALTMMEVLGPDLTMAVNASSGQLNHPDFCDGLVRRIYAGHLDPSRLIIEVTESAILNMASRARPTIERLAALGVGVYVDDFGTGFSSITHLRDLPVTGLKLDRSFVSELTSSASPSYRLAEGLASLARSLNLIGVAEGIETPAQRRLLQECGWHHGQGWLFGHAEDLTG